MKANTQELAALQEMIDVLSQGEVDLPRLRLQFQAAYEDRKAGVGWKEIMESDFAGEGMQSMSRFLRRLSLASGPLRRQVVIGLRDEKLTIPAIAARLRVTHQRVSNILKRAAE